jgi:hypothetical protein
LTKDGAWCVRLACVEIIVNISEISSPETRKNHLIEPFLAFFKDPNIRIITAAYEKIGEFVYNLIDTGIPDSLLQIYKSMTNEEVYRLGENNRVIININNIY